MQSSTPTALNRPASIAPAEEGHHLNFLDGLRGGAALWVLLAHCMIWGGWYKLPLPDAKIAVDIFMVVSGYLMVYLAEERARQEPPGTAATIMKFWVRRFFRIAPLYYLILVFTFIFGEHIKEGCAALQAANPIQWEHADKYSPDLLHYSLTNFLMHVSFLFGLFPAYSSATGLPDWSIGLEMQFYAVFPLLLFLFHRLGSFRAALLIWCAGFALKHATYLLLGETGFPEPSFLPLKLSLFVVGMLLATTNRTFTQQPAQAAAQMALAAVIASRASFYIVVIAGLCVLMGQCATSLEPRTAATKAFFGRLLGNRITRFMADTSYGVYLVHAFFITLAGGWLFAQPAVLAMKPMLRTALLTAITLPGSYLVAWLLHQLIEQPGIKLGRHLLARRKTAVPSARLATAASEPTET